MDGEAVRSTPAPAAVAAPDAGRTEAQAHAFVLAWASGAAVGREDRWFTPDAIQVEWPHPLLPHGAVRDLHAIRDAGARTARSGRRSDISIAELVCGGERVAVQAIETCHAGRDVIACGAGSARNAIAMFLRLRDGRVCHQHIYRCPV